MLVNYFQNFRKKERILDGVAPSLCNQGEQKLSDDLVGKLVEMYQSRSICGSDILIRKRELETCYFGKMKSDVYCRMYNKTKEVKSKKDTDFPLRWEDNGWNRKDEVIRVEFSLKRGFLKQLSNDEDVSLKKICCNVENIWRYLTERWIRMVEEVKVNNSKTSIVTEFWTIVQNSFSEVVTNIVRKRKFKGKITQLYLQGMGCISQMISMGMSDDNDVGYLNSTIDCINDLLRNQDKYGEYYRRRKALGLV